MKTITMAALAAIMLLTSCAKVVDLPPVERHRLATIKTDVDIKEGIKIAKGFVRSQGYAIRGFVHSQGYAIDKYEPELSILKTEEMRHFYPFGSVQRTLHIEVRDGEMEFFIYEKAMGDTSLCIFEKQYQELVNAYKEYRGEIE